MIPLTLSKETIQLSLHETVKKAFNQPILFYLFHKDDVRNFFVILAIFDAKNNCFKIYNSFTEANKKKLEALKYEELFYMKKSSNPHHMMSLKDGRLMLFIEMEPFFYIFDKKKERLEVHSILDSLQMKQGERFISMSPTVYKDESGEDFYFSIWKIRDKRSVVEYYKAKLNMTGITKLYEEKTAAGSHSIRPYKGVLYHSLFNDNKFIEQKSGELFNKYELYRKVLKELFQKYCELIAEDYSDTKFADAVEFFFHGYNDRYRLSPDFDYFLRSHYKTTSIIELCSLLGYQFQGLPGAILSYDLQTKKLQSYETSKPTPAHFEIDEETDYMYVSNHNFGLCYEEKMHMIGPAAIDKFQITPEGLKKIATFEHEEGYRFASHVVFCFEEKKYIATVGHPNRLYFINAESMELEYFDTIGEDILAKQKDIYSYMIQADMAGKESIKAIQVSGEDGLVFLLAEEYIYIYSFPEKKIIEKIEYDAALSSVGLEGFERKTTHCHYF